MRSSHVKPAKEQISLVELSQGTRERATMFVREEGWNNRQCSHVGQPNSTVYPGFGIPRKGRLLRSARMGGRLVGLTK